MKRVAIVGAGWAGCTAAVELARAGWAVTVYEAARTVGGRARHVEIDGLALDNGQHILLGAYAETLRLMKTVGIQPDDVLLRLPLQMRYAGPGMDFVTPRLPAPLHMLVGLLRAKGLLWEDKMSLARFSTTARWMDWRLNIDCSVAELLDRFDQTDRLIQLMWRPLCIAALNTPPERASAQVFLAVLRDSLGARRAASDMLLPRVDLGMLFPQQAAHFVEQHGGVVRTGVAIRRIDASEHGWRIASAQETAEADAVVIAVHPAQVGALLGDALAVPELQAMSYEPITTCYLRYAADTRLDTPFYALLDDASAARWGQFVFDRGQLDSRQAGLLAVVVSASNEAVALPQEALARDVASQLADVFGRKALLTPQWVKVISEKRATFSCTPALARPQNRTERPGLVLAGDYTAGDYPATLEAAVRSGVEAARCVLATA
ncbi:FAD-dependent oxidoreductase [Oxalobacteraceae bacterium OM1]|nr:FAD-dependent oxidoreductase [Oxalobacteraceae bacterium OM1]